ncbi:MAG: hypothetical protein JWN34_5729 [Bryobacterales bacterium]|jgi:carbon monoxide dehydrogenase subunit G|nr:hypothetical protein [Bryobacterales bacterium]
MVQVVNQVGSPRPVVFGVLTDFENYPAWVPDCEQAVITSKDENVTNVDITMNGMKKVTLSVQFQCEKDEFIRFQLAGQSSDVKTYSGTYRLRNAEGDGGTVVVAELDVDAGLLVPQMLVDSMVKKSLKESGSALNSYAKAQEDNVTN